MDGKIELDALEIDSVSMDALTCLDLFCGCGGFTLGMQRAGFNVLAAMDFNQEAIAALQNNLIDNCPKGLKPVGYALNCDLTKYNPKELATLINTKTVDVIVGGPPCQGFSTARQVDGANHGARLKEDPRRLLYQEYLRYVDFFQPKVFVIENVLGIRSAAGGEYFTRVQNEARALGSVRGKPGYRVHAQIEEARVLGVPQKRRRQLIIGVRNDLPGYFPSELKSAPFAIPETPLGAAIADLPRLSAGSGQHECEYDIGRREKSIEKYGVMAKNYLDKVLQVSLAKKLTNHVARPHNERDLRDFKLLSEGENSATAMRERGEVFEFPYDKTSFKDRYTRQSSDQPCSTIVAHLSKDGLMFIHPKQNRSLTPREAARVQSFPDWYVFPSARTHAFRLIGNAVPPLVAEAVGLAVMDFIAVQAPVEKRKDKSGKTKTREKVIRAASVDSAMIRIPDSHDNAIKILDAIAGYGKRELGTITKEEFLQAWHALLFMYPGLHPDNALDHGKAKEQNLLAMQNGVMPDRFAEYYLRSGWPVVLEQIGREAWRRYDNKELTEEEFYCVDAQRAGLCPMDD